MKGSPNRRDREAHRYILFSFSRMCATLTRSGPGWESTSMYMYICDSRGIPQTGSRNKQWEAPKPIEWSFKIMIGRLLSLSAATAFEKSFTVRGQERADSNQPGGV